MIDRSPQWPTQIYYYSASFTIYLSSLLMNGEKCVVSPYGGPEKDHKLRSETFQLLKMF